MAGGDSGLKATQIIKLKRVIDWRPHTPFYYGWLVIFMVALGSFAATSAAGVVLGGIQGFIFEDTGWSRASIGLVAGLGVWGTGVSGPVIGRLVDRYGARKLMPLGTLILGVCLVSFIWADSFWQFLVIAIVARIVSQPILIGIVPRAVAVNFFRRRRNTVLAMTSIFRPFSGAINIQLFSVLAAAYGWRSTYRFLGIFSLALTLPMALLMRRGPEGIGLRPDGDQAPARRAGVPLGQPDGPQREGPAAATAEESWTALEALRTRSYWLVALTAFLSTTAHTSVSFSLVPYLREAAGLSIGQAAGVLSLSTALVLSNLGWGYLAEKISARKGIVVSIIFSMVMIVFLLTVRSLYAAYIFGALWGVGTSAMEVMISIMLARYFGRGSYGTIAGAMRPFEAGGLGVGSILGGVIYDLTGSYHGLFLGGLAAYFLGMMLILKAAAPPRPAGAAASVA